MRAAVIGGGIGGLAAALALARPDREITLYERAAAPRETGAGLQLGPNGVRALRALGVAETLEPLAAQPKAVVLRRGGDDAVLLRTPLPAHYWQLRRQDLHAALSMAAARAGVRMVYGAADLTVDPARGEVGANGGAEPSDPIVGADGVFSTLRDAVVGSATAPRFTGRAAWRGLSSTPTGEATVRLGAGGRWFVSYPLADGTTNFVGVVPASASGAEDWAARGDLAALARAFAGWPAAERVIAGCGEPFLWPLYDRPPLPRWTSGRLALLGDAAHPIPPHLAQGAALALEDAVVLGRCLDHWPVSEALARYQAARRPRAAAVLVASRRQAALFSWGGRAAALGGPLAPWAGRRLGVAPTRSLDAIYGYDPTTAPI